MQQKIEALKYKLTSYKKKYHLNQLIKGLLILGIVMVSLFLVFNGLEFTMRFGKAIRATLFFAFLGTFLYIFFKYVLQPILAILFITGFLNDEIAAKQIGNFFPKIADKLLNTLQLEKEAKDNSLAAASVLQKSASLSEIDFDMAIPWQQNKLYLKYFLVPCSLLIIALLIAPTFLKENTNRIIQYNDSFKEEAPFNFHLLNAKKIAFRNEDYTVNLKLEGVYTFEDAYVFSKNRKIKMSKVDENTFEYTFEKVQQSFKIHFISSGFDSKSFEIKVVDRPNIHDMLISLNFPKYLNKKTENLENSGNIIVPEGTTVSWKIDAPYADKITASFDSIKYEMDKSSSYFSFQKTAKTSKKYELVLTNKFGKNKKKILYDLEVIKDEHPTIELEQYKDTTMYKFLVLGGNIADDYGLISLSFFYKKLNDKKRNVPFMKKNIKINKNLNSQSFFYQFVLDSVKISQGERLEYYLQVWDNDGFNGSKSTKTPTYTFKLPNQKEIEKKISDGITKTEKQMEKVLNKARDMKESVRKVQDELKRKKSLDWKDEKNISQLIEKRKELEEEIKKLQELNEINKEQQERFSERDQRIMEKSQKLKELMNELLDEETKKLYQELQKLIDQNTPLEEVQDIFEKMDIKEDALEKEIERSIELFKKMKFDQKMQENINKLKKLAKEQEKISEKTRDKNVDIEELKLEQRFLNEDFEDFKNDMKELNEINEDRKRPDNLKAYEKETLAIEEKLKNSKENIDNKKRKEGQKNQKDAAKKMKDLAEKMEESQSSMEMETMEEDLDNLRQIIDNLIKLSFTQEKLMKDFRGIKQSDPRFITLSQEQLKLNNDSQIIQDSLLALGQRVFQINAFVSDEIQKNEKQHE